MQGSTEREIAFSSVSVSPRFAHCIYCYDFLVPFFSGTIKITKGSEKKMLFPCTGGKLSRAISYLHSFVQPSGLILNLPYLRNQKEKKRLKRCQKGKIVSI